MTDIEPPSDRFRLARRLGGMTIVDCEGQLDMTWMARLNRVFGIDLRGVRSAAANCA